MLRLITGLVLNRSAAAGKDGPKVRPCRRKCFRCVVCVLFIWMVLVLQTWFQKSPPLLLAPDVGGKEMEALLDWIRANGGYGYEHLRVAHIDKNGHKVRGLVAVHGMVSPEDANSFSSWLGSWMPGSSDNDSVVLSEVFTVPAKVILSMNHPMVANSAFKDVTVSYGVWNCSVLLYFAEERCKIRAGGSSFWEPFIRMLPTANDYALHHPWYAEPEVLANFSLLPACQNAKWQLDEIQMLWDSNKEEWTRLSRLSQRRGAEAVTFEDFKWALISFVTHAYKLRWPGSKEPLRCLVPASDMANNNAESGNLDWQGDLSGEPLLFRVKLRQSIRRGEELTEEYRGPRNNELMFRQYGFLLPQNPVPVQQLSTEKCEILRGPMTVDPAVSSHPGILENFQNLAREHCVEAGVP